MFTTFMGDTPRARLLDFLGDHPTSDYNMTEIAANADMTRPTAYKVVDELLGLGIVIHTRDVGQSKLFRINTDHDVVRSILKADMAAARDGLKPLLTA